MKKKTIDGGEDGVPTRRGAKGAVGREVDGLVEGDVVDNHSFPLEPPVGQFPLGHDEEGVDFILADFLQDAVEEGPMWGDVGTNEVPVVGKRVAS